jgi:hypothetical protein
MHGSVTFTSVGGLSRILKPSVAARFEGLCDLHHAVSFEQAAAKFPAHSPLAENPA